jgi:hypothetical protein
MRRLGSGLGAALPSDYTTAALAGDGPTGPNLEGEPPVVSMQIDWELVLGGAV